MSISANFPNVFPSLELNFANSQQLDPRVTFSRSTTAPYYDGKTSVLAEQNLFIQSNTFTNAAWVATSATIASGVTAPDGTATAYSMTATAGNATLYQTLTLTATAYTESIWIQRVTGTGTINLTLDGSTLSPVTITGSWAKYTYTATPSAGSKTIGIQVVTSGDAINIYGSQLENRSSATATNITTTSAITNYIPQLLTAPINAPRFDFNPTTGESLGLLIEQSSTNLFTYSQDFSNAVWTKSNATITTGANIAPDGTQTATYLVCATVSTGFLRQNFTSIPLTTYTYSVEAKTGASNFIQIKEDNYFGSVVDFNLTTGTFAQTGVFTGSMTPLGNGWYRCTATLTYNAGQTGGFISIRSLGCYVWGAQLEALAFPTSYIPTTSAQVTRASDIDSMPTSGWYNQAQGTFYTNVYDSQSSIARAFTLDDGISSSNQIAIGYDVSRVRVNAVDVGSFYTITSITGQRTIAYNTNQQSASNNGASVSSTTSSPAPPNMTTLRIGQSSVGTFLNGHIRKLAYYSIYLTTTNQQALTGS